MVAEGSDRDYVQSLERGFAVLLAFNEELANPTLAELAAATGFSRPAVRRLLLTLQRLGYVKNQGIRWSLTPRVLSIGQHYSAAQAMIEVAQPHLLRLAERTDESASLAELDGFEAVYVARVQVRRIMSINVSIGTRVPAHATSVGRVLLAWAGPERIARFLKEAPMPALAPATVSGPEELEARLAKVREQGYALIEGEVEDWLMAAAAPVRDGTGQVVAAAASSTTMLRMSPKGFVREMVPMLVEAADAISSDLLLLSRPGANSRI